MKISGDQVARPIEADTDRDQDRKEDRNTVTVGWPIVLHIPDDAKPPKFEGWPKVGS